MSAPEKGSLADVAKVAFRLGCTAFGGPAAHIAMLHDEVVVRRKWITEQHFLDMLGVTNLIPGPNSTEMLIHMGYEQAGIPGLLTGGLLFILPAAVMALALAALYVQYGATPQGASLLYGIKPVIVAIVAQALWKLGTTAIKGPFLAMMAAATLGLYILGVNELVLLFGIGLLVMVIQNTQRLRDGSNKALSILWALKLPALVGGMAAAVMPYDALQLFLTFLKIGATLYGSGYVLLAFLHSDFVVRLGWLTDQQLLDAVAVGQFTPGPLSTTATFIGFLMGGIPGGVIATIGIFLPSFIFVAIFNPLIPRLRSSVWTAGLLDGVNVAALGLMAAVTLQLGETAIKDWLTAGIAIIAGILLIKFKVNSVWLVLGGGVIGIVYWLVTRG
jgi:chromate transporter